MDQGSDYPTQRLRGVKMDQGSGYPAQRLWVNRWIPRAGLNFGKNLGVYVILISMAVLMIAPFLWLLSSSLKYPDQQFAFPPTFFPWPMRWANYSDLFSIIPMGRYIVTSLIVAITSMIGAVLSCSLPAFAFARMRFRGRRVLFSILLATMMVPFAIRMIPLFMLFKRIGWIDTLLPLIVPNFFGNAFLIFLLRQAFLTIPQDIFDAAKVDGASYFQIYWQLFLPLSIPALATASILTFLWNWNDLLGPLIFVVSPANWTVQLGLSLLRGRAGTNLERFGIMMAGALIGALPMLVLYLFGQRYFIQGLARTGSKS